MKIESHRDGRVGTAVDVPREARLGWSFAEPDGHHPPRGNVNVDRQIASGRG